MLVVLAIMHNLLVMELLIHPDCVASFGRYMLFAVALDLRIEPGSFAVQWKPFFVTKLLLVLLSLPRVTAMSCVSSCTHQKWALIPWVFRCCGCDTAENVAFIRILQWQHKSGKSRTNTLSVQRLRWWNCSKRCINTLWLQHCHKNCKFIVIIFPNHGAMGIT